MVCPGWSACTYLKGSFFFPPTFVFTLRAWCTFCSLHCWSTVWRPFFFFNRLNTNLYLEYLFLFLGIQWSCSLTASFTTETSWAVLARVVPYFTKGGEIEEKERTSLSWLHLLQACISYCVGVWVAFGSEQDLCSGEAQQGSWKQRASVKELT